MESQNTTDSLSASLTLDLDSLSKNEYPFGMELLKVATILGQLDELAHSAELNHDGCLEDETLILEKLSEFHKAFYALHDCIFRQIAWTSERRKRRLNPQLFSSRRPLPRPLSDEDMKRVRDILGL